MDKVFLSNVFEFLQLSFGLSIKNEIEGTELQMAFLLFDF